MTILGEQYFQTDEAMEAARQLDELFAARTDDGARLLDELRLVLPTLRSLVRLAQANEHAIRRIEKHIRVIGGRHADARRS